MDVRTTDGSNVYTFMPKNPKMMFTAISQVDAYWEGLRDGRLMPDRAEIDPRGLQDNLEFALMLEHIAPGVARIRVAGSHICDLLGMEVRGMPITSLFEPTSRAKLAETLDYVVGKPCVAEIDISSPQAIGRPALTGRLYLAPLRCQFSEHRRILGCLQTQVIAFFFQCLILSFQRSRFQGIIDDDPQFIYIPGFCDIMIYFTLVDRINNGLHITIAS